MMIGCGLWAITLGQFDIHYAISTFSQFSMNPREGHMQALFRVFGYLRAYVKGKIIVDTREPNNDKFLSGKHDWTKMYPGAKEELPKTMPKELGKEVEISTSLYHFISLYL